MHEDRDERGLHQEPERPQGKHLLQRPEGGGCDGDAGLPPAHQLGGQDLRAGSHAGVRGPDDGQEPPDGQEDQPLHPHPPVRRRPHPESPDASPHLSRDGQLLPALCGLRRAQRPLHDDLRDRREARDHLLQAARGVPQEDPGGELHARGRHDGPQGGPLQAPQ